MSIIGFEPMSDSITANEFPTTPNAQKKRKKIN